MTTATSQRQPELTGQNVVVIGGGASSGLQTARRTRAAGADILTGRGPDPRERAAAGLGAPSSAAFDAVGPAAHQRFSGSLPERAGHMVVTAVGPAVR